MKRSAGTAILWAIVAAATFQSYDTVANAMTVDEDIKIHRLDALLNQENNRISLNQNDQNKLESLLNQGNNELLSALNQNSQVRDDSLHIEEDQNENETKPALNETIVATEEETEVEESIAEENENENENENEKKNETPDFDIQVIQKKLRKNKITDILVGCFFFVAAVWLLLASGYSIILLILLRLQARGELDIYDENLGMLVLFDGRVNVHFGWILRRFAIQLEEVRYTLVVFGLFDDNRYTVLVSQGQDWFKTAIHSLILFFLLFYRIIKCSYNDN